MSDDKDELGFPLRWSGTPPEGKVVGLGPLPDDLAARRVKRRQAAEACEVCEGAGEAEVLIDCPACVDQDNWVAVEVAAPPRVRVKLSPGAQVPVYQTAGAVGCDLHAYLTAPVVLYPGQRCVIDCGVAFEIPEGFEAQVRGRSGLFRNHGVEAKLGTIDQDYRQTAGIQLINLGADKFIVEPGDRIAQLVIAPVARAAFEVVDELSATDRRGGFGSTGVR